MPVKPETKFRQKADKDLDAIPNSWFETIQQKTIVGTPDKLGCVNGHFVAIEFKKDAKSPMTKMQEYKGICIANKAKGIHFLAYPENWGNIIKYLMKLGGAHEYHIKAEEFIRSQLFPSS